jgi:hypothetical protein
MATDRQALAITRDYMGQAEATYRTLGAAPAKGLAKTARSKPANKARKIK